MKASMIVSVILGLFLAVQVNAQEAPKKEEAAAKTKEEAPQKVDMNNIEKKYWQPSDQSYSVVQSRTYAKEKKFGVSLLGGPILMDSWSTGFNFEVAASYYFTERWGVEVQGSFYSTDDSDTTKKIFEMNGSPDFGRVTSFMGVMARWVPFYSKMSFMGSKVVYFDMSFGLGAGLIGYEQQLSTVGGGGRTNESASAPAVAFDVSQTYFINPKFAFRVDYKMRFFNEEILAYNAGNHGGTTGDVLKLRDEFNNISSLNLGVTYYF